MKKLPIGIQNIHEILTQGYVYVDKTSFAQQLIQNGKHYFLSRPRRFGKSLFLSTLKEILQGNKDLFKQCAIYHSDYHWQSYPVLAFDFANLDSTTTEALKAGLADIINRLGSAHSIALTGSSIQFRLQVLVEELAKKNRVVVLIDEYDSPIISHLKDPQVAEQNRDFLRGFFATLKSLDEYLKFTFTTGISKFSQVSLFSGPNNLEDITMDPTYAAMMGYTEQELTRVFDAHIQAIARHRGEQGKAGSEQDVLAELKHWYNGYRFSKAATLVYNPFSTLRFMKAKEAQSYWYSSGTPSFLLQQLQGHPEAMVPLTGSSARKSDLMDISSLKHIDLRALMFQTGYLTIQGYNELTGHYHLGFPNQEVRAAFIDSLTKHLATRDTKRADQCYRALLEQQVSLFFEHLQATLASFPYRLFINAQERTYQAILLGILHGLGVEVVAEKSSNLGQADLVLEMPTTSYVMELKLDGSAEAALDQIHQKAYYQAYLHQGKELVLLGVSLSSKARNVETWCGELLDQTGKRLRTLIG